MTAAPGDEGEPQKAAAIAEMVMDAARDSVQFLARFAVGPLEQASGMLTDHLKYVRWERQVRLRERAEQFLRDRGLSKPTRPVPLKVLVPLVEAASLEEDNYLQDLWAQLLVNAGDAGSNVSIERSFVAILEEMSALEARCLRTLCEAPETDRGGGLATWNLPDRTHRAGTTTERADPAPDVNVALWNLVRLGCVASGGLVLRVVQITPLGRALYNAVQSRPRPSAPLP